MSMNRTRPTGGTILISLLVLLPACGRTDETDEAVGEEHAAEVMCPARASGTEALTRPGAITLFGEIHGTAEVPSFVGALACQAAQRHPVLVGLEIPDGMDEALAAYLASEGSDVDKEGLLEHRFWTLEDGRSSRAMLGLIDTLRQLNQAGKSVEVFGFDGVFPGGEARDRGMAATIVTRMKSSNTEDTVVLLLTGNLHARTSDERWMGWHVAREFPQLTSLNNAFSGGTAWVCTNEGCGPRGIGGRDRGDGKFVERNPEPDENGYHGILYLDSASASPPARGYTGTGGAEG